MTTPTRRGALLALREGRVTILAAYPDETDETENGPPFEVVANVRSSRPPVLHQVALMAGRWSCSSCPTWQTTNRCAHVYAVQLVTGHAPEEVS